MTTRAVAAPVVALLLAALSGGLSCASDPGPPEEPPDCHELGDRFLEEIRAGRVEPVSDLFHFPEEFTRAELAEDRENLIRFLGVLVAQMGVPRDSRPLPRIASSGNVRVETAKPEYWSIFAATRDRSAWSAHVSFDRDGSGFVGFECVDLGSEWRLRAVSFGLVSATDDVHPRMRNIEAALQREFSPPGERGTEPQ